MSLDIRRVEYFYTTVKDQPGEAYNLLSWLAELGVNLLAFTAVPVGPGHTQLALFPEDAPSLTHAAVGAGMALVGPHPAFLVSGDDELGSLAGIHSKLYKADVNVYAASGVTDGKGSFGYLIYLRSDDVETAAKALGI
jgi:hypothetical protein